ncbi:hypothetical protein [Streptomyces luteireticuli]|uniref:hypothetical protein n=1 Tax=Streptomyces luteireticuli TaxID=173858 RepID=UPI003558A9A6
MIGWSQIAYGAALSAVAAAVLVRAVTGKYALAVYGAFAAAAGPLAWNSILVAAHGDRFFTDAPVTVFPVSWQDTGSGVFAFTVAALVYGLGPLAREPARRTVGCALLTAAAALAIDVYLY